MAPLRFTPTTRPRGGWRPTICWIADCGDSPSSPRTFPGRFRCSKKGFSGHAVAARIHVRCVRAVRNTAPADYLADRPSTCRGCLVFGVCLDRRVCSLPISNTHYACWISAGLKALPCRNKWRFLPMVTIPVLYNMTAPPLSGVDTNPSLVGYKAAALLDRLMAGQPPPRDVLWVSPARVVARQSTDVNQRRRWGRSGMSCDSYASTPAEELMFRTWLPQPAWLDVPWNAASMNTSDEPPKRKSCESNSIVAKMLLECGDTSIEVNCAKQRLCLVQKLLPGYFDARLA